MNSAAMAGFHSLSCFGFRHFGAVFAVLAHSLRCFRLTGAEYGLIFSNILWRLSCVGSYPVAQTFGQEPIREDRRLLALSGTPPWESNGFH